MNEIQLIGRISNELKLELSKKQKEFLRFNIAITDRFDNTQFIPIIIFGPQANWVSKYLDKGDLISIVGSVSYKTSKDKNDHYTSYFNVLVSRVTSLESKISKEARKHSKELILSEENLFDESIFE